jgi:putative phosphoesterase
MRKIGLISDIHGDPEALGLALAHLAALGAERVICAGDLVGYGPDPDRVVAILAEHQIEAVRGNHDRWALQRGVGVADEFGGGTPNDATLGFLRALPAHRLFSGEGRVGVVVHGSPRSDMEYVTRESHPPGVLRRLLDELGADMLVVGHTHAPMCFRCERGLVVNPGSVIGLPVVESSRTFALVDLAELSVSFHDVRTGRALTIPPWADKMGVEGSFP